MRPVPVLAVLLLLSSLALLCAAPVAGWAAPTIEEWKVEHIALLHDNGPGGSSLGWIEHVGARIRGEAGIDSIGGLTVWEAPGPPDGTVHPDGHWRWCPQTDGSVWICASWDDSTRPAGGAYTLVTYGTDGSESAAITTPPFTHFAEPVPEVTYPQPGSVITDTAATLVFSWPGYGGFTGEGAPPVAYLGAGVSGAEGCLWLGCGAASPSATSVRYGEGMASPPELEPGRTYNGWLWAVAPDVAEVASDGTPGTYAQERAGRTWPFTIYSPVPAIARLEVRRGYDVSPEGAIGYRQRAMVFASDGDGAADIASVSLIDSQGLQHDAWWVCDRDQTTAAFCWDSSGEATPSPAGAYTATVTDQEGLMGTALTQVSALPTDPGFVPVLSTPANDSVATATPEFSWSVPLGEGCYCLTMWEPNGPCQVWCPWLVSSPIGYGGADLFPGHLYDWSLNSFNLDPIAQSDPAAVSRFQWSVTSAFWVEPRFVGFLEPINDDGSSLFRLGTTVPVKFRLVKADGTQVTDATCELHLAKVTDDVTGTELEVVSAGAADSGNTFRYAADHYQFNLSTRVLSKGTYRLWVTINGDVVHEGTISLQ